ncbi:hypothetical protein GCM10027290_29020 [Micromonospora sonneratiae]|uniref:TransglutaminaseTgpA domain-containing protein n=1 Tax=Micromonospora sonneratiae TaxID=1184706 RepID=A0ABW3YAJ8_9ACTN
MRVRTGLAGTAVVVATVAAVLPVTGMYASGPLPLLLAVAATGGALSGAGLRGLRLSSGTTFLGGLLALVGALLVVAAVAVPRSDAALPGAVWAAVRHAGAHVLTGAAPLPVTLDTVALPFCAAWLTALAAALPLRARRPTYAALPPVLLFVATLVLVGPTTTPAYVHTAVLVAALAVLLGVLGTDGGGRRRGAAVAVLTVGLAVVAVGAGPVLTGGLDRQPPDVRAHVVPPYQNPEQLNPLSLLSGWATDPARPLLEVRGDQPVRLRWVTLPEFNGVTWLPARDYRAAGALLPVAELPGRTTSVRHEVTVTGLTGGWLPVPEGVREVRGVTVAVDRDTATLAVPGGLRPATRYTVAAGVPVREPERLAAAVLPVEASFDRYRMLPPGGPPQLYELARAAAGGASSGPYQQASRLAEYLRREYRFDPRAPGGNGYPSLDRFLSQPTVAGGGRGTSEQFATAFVVLARALGIPARVVVGFRAGQPVGDGRYLVRTGDAVAWPEVYLADVGWVEFDPTPAPAEQVDRPTAARPALTPTPGPEVRPDDGSGVGDEFEPLAGPRDGDGGEPFSSRLGGLAAVPAVLLALVVAVVVLRLRRSAVRLRRRDPAGRVLGAWAELRDGLRLTGRTPDDALVVAEVAGLAADAVGAPVAERVRSVAALVNGIAYGGVEPDRDAAERVAVDVRACLRALRRGAGRSRRWTWWADPRPLWWR